MTLRVTSGFDTHPMRLGVSTWTLEQVQDSDE